ncbi:MAG: helix-turn-helix domain containing protein [Acidobacteriota bacterium]
MKDRQEDPRANQKERTRAAIVEAALRLRDRGVTPTIADAAREGGVSRATAYRYFPNRQALLVEIAEVEPAVVPVETLLSELEGADVAKRFDELVELSATCFLAHEADMRRALWVYQDTWLRSDRGGVELPALREGRRMRWLDRVLEPLADLPENTRQRLRAALALTIGMDSLAIMKDVCRLNDEEAVDALRWAGNVLLKACLEEASE